MPFSRRDFVAGTAATLLSAVPNRLFAGHALGRHQDRLQCTALKSVAIPTDFNRMKILALHAVDAARSAGAMYADVRLSRIVTQNMMVQGGPSPLYLTDQESYGFGVRALVDGYWGFASSPYWEEAEATALAKSAVAQAKANTVAGPRVVEWTPIPSVTGEWTSKGIDPFTITLEEKMDLMNGWGLPKFDTYYKDFVMDGGGGGQFVFDREDWFLASTEGTAVRQTLYTTLGDYGVRIRHRDPELARENGFAVEHALGIHKQRGGWEVMLDAKLPEQIPAMMDRAVKQMGIGVIQSDIGRFDVVFSGEATGRLLGETFGAATQLDRALGYEANASGTSYLGPDPLKFLGTGTVASPLVSVQANRSDPSGLATVKWDQEGATPREFDLIKQGVLVDYQTTREQVGWLKAWYDKTQGPTTSHGCAAGPSAIDLPMQHVPNLVMTPSSSNETFESLVSGVKRGIAVITARPSLDYQAKNGMIANATLREIVNGKLGDTLLGGGILFNSHELWNNVTAIGGPRSATVVEGNSRKGQPEQTCAYSISAVPMAVKNVSVVDVLRRA